jgi:hypothetical protein
MILTMLVINSDATLNNFKESTVATFIPGEALTLALRLQQIQRPIRYVPDVAAVITLTLLKSDNTTLTKTATFIDASDRSLLKFELTALETADVIGQNLRVDIVEGLIESTAILQYGLKSMHLGC